MTDRQTIFPALANHLIRAFADEPVLLDGMKVVFDDKVGLYPARVELTDEPASGPADIPGVRAIATPSPATLRSRIDGR